MALEALESARQKVDEARHAGMTYEGVLLDRVLSAVERVANTINPPSIHASDLFNIVTAARALHDEHRAGR